MKKVEVVNEAMVYRSTKIYSQIDKQLQKEVEAGKHRSYNSAVNHHLQNSLGIEIPTYLTLGRLSVKDRFRFANNCAFKEYVVREKCKRSHKHKGVVRRCEEIKTGKIVYPRCDREVIKIE